MTEPERPAPIDHPATEEDDSIATRDERERALFALLPGDASAREELTLLYRPLAESLARRLQGRGESIDDLSQVAMLGLINAIDRFDPGRDVKFSTFATVTVAGELKRHFRDRAWAVHVPRKMKETSLAVSTATSRLSQALGRSPTVREISAEIGLPEEEVLDAMDLASAYAPASLDAPAGEEEGAPTPFELGEEDPNIELLEGWATVAPELRKLAARERRILYMRFVQNRSQTQIAEAIGISQMHVSRLLARTLAQLRSALEDEATE